MCCNTETVFKKKSKGRLNCFWNTLYIFLRLLLVTFSCQDVSSESPDPGRAAGLNQLQMILQVRARVRNTIYVLWMQKSQAMTLCNPPQHLNSQSAHWYPHWRQTRKPIELFSSFFFLIHFHIIFCLQLSVSPSTSRQTVSADTALQRSASLYTTRNQFLQAAMKKRRKKKEKIRPVLRGEIEGQNVNFPGNPSLVDWIVKRSSNAHFNTR